MLNKIREFFWPLLEGEPYIKKKVSIDDILCQLGENKENAARLLEISKDINKAEDERIKTVEAKATTILGATGLIITLILNFSKELFLRYPQNICSYFISAFFVITILYFFQAVSFALKAVSRKGYHQISPNEVISNFKSDNNYTFDTRIAAFILEKTQNNYAIVDEKVDYMVMSQEYFRRGLYVILFIAIILYLKPFLVFLP